MPRPNLILIFTDQLSFRALGAYGSTICRTPAMDRMAAQGVVFDRCYASSALCGPSRFATYTGLSAFANPNWANPNCAKLDFIPYMGDIFAAAGYRTGSIGKLHGIPEDFDFGFAFCKHNWGLKGPFAFNDYGNWVRDQVAKRPDRAAVEAAIAKPRSDGFGLDDDAYFFLPPELSEEAWLLEETDNFLAADPGNRPFLLNLCIQHPHPAWETLPAADERYPVEDLPLPPNFETRSPIVDHLHQGRGHGRAPDEWRRWMSRYYTSVTQVDKAVGEILAKLERRGLAENTVVILTTDHGELLGQYNRSQKMCLYEEAIHIPFIVWGAGIPAGQHRAQLAEQVDILPTLLDLAGAAGPDHLEGVSLVPAIHDPAAPTRPVAHSWLEFQGEVHAMARSDNYKLYRLYGRDHRRDIGEFFELYDLPADPYEMANLWPDNYPDTPEIDALKGDFCDYFWEKAGTVGCSLKTRTALGQPPK